MVNLLASRGLLKLAAPNSKLKLARPGFGPAAEPPGPNTSVAVSRRLQIVRRCPAVCAATAAPLFA
jgi:hypothetical protein